MRSITLKATRKERMKTEVINGISFVVSLSPYFFPETIQCTYKAETGCLVINFKYIEDEPRERSQENFDYGMIWVGKHTGKLLSIQIRVDKHDIDHVEMSVIDKAFDAIKYVQAKHPDMQDNYEAAEDALREHEKEIADLVPA